MRFWTLLRRDVLVAWRKKSGLYQPLVFQLLVVTMFPLGLGAGAQTLAKISPAVVWILALLSTLITFEHLFKDDYEDGSMDLYYLSDMSLPMAVLAKAMAHWITTGIPVILFAPIIGMLLHLPNQSFGILLLSLALATPIFSLLGAVGSALTMNLRNGGMHAPTPTMVPGASVVSTEGLANAMASGADAAPANPANVWRLKARPMRSALTEAERME